MTSVCQGLSSFAQEGGKMKDPGNEVGNHLAGRGAQSHRTRGKPTALF